MIRLLRPCRLVWTFYRGFFAAPLLITACCMSIFHAHGRDTLVILIWFKIITSALLVYVVNIYKRKNFYYYRNLSISVRWLWTVSLGFDVVLFVFLMILTANFR